MCTHRAGFCSSKLNEALHHHPRLQPWRDAVEHDAAVAVEREGRAARTADDLFVGFVGAAAGHRPRLCKALGAGNELAVCLLADGPSQAAARDQALEALRICAQGVRWAP